MGLLKLEGNIYEDGNDNSSGVPCATFKVRNSEYLKWAISKCGGANEAPKLIHFVVYTVDWILEILNDTDPKAEIIDLE